MPLSGALALLPEFPKRPVFRYSLHQRPADLAGGTCFCCAAQQVKRAFDFPGRYRILPLDQNFPVCSGAERTISEQQFFIELFAGAQPRLDDGDFTVGEVSCQTDQPFRKVENPHRAAHVKQIDARAAFHCSGAQYQLYRLGNGHKIADHPPVGDGHRPAPLDLPQEERHNRAV